MEINPRTSSLSDGHDVVLNVLNVERITRTLYNRTKFGSKVPFSGSDLYVGGVRCLHDYWLCNRNQAVSCTTSPPVLSMNPFPWSLQHLNISPRRPHRISTQVSISVAGTD